MNIYQAIKICTKRKMNKLTSFLIEEQQARYKGGIYHKTQVQLAYNPNHIESSKLSM